MGNGAKRARNRFDAIAVAHPDAMLAPFEPLEQDVVAVNHQRRRPVLAIPRAYAARAHVLRDHVQAVADSEHRAAEVEHLIRNIRCVLFVQTGRSAGKNYSPRIQRADFNPARS